MNSWPIGPPAGTMSARFDCEPNNTRAGSYSTWLVGPGACLVLSAACFCWRTDTMNRAKTCPRESVGFFERHDMQRLMRHIGPNSICDQLTSIRG